MNNRNRNTYLRVPKPTLGTLRHSHNSARNIVIFPEPEKVQSPGVPGTALVSNGLLLISGRNLKFTPYRPDEGVWFIPADPNEQPVKAGTVVEVREKSLMLMVPQLASGKTYFIEITARRSSRTLRTTRASQAFRAI